MYGLVDWCGSFCIFAPHHVYPTWGHGYCAPSPGPGKSSVSVPVVTFYFLLWLFLLRAGVVISIGCRMNMVLFSNFLWWRARVVAKAGLHGRGDRCGLVCVDWTMNTSRSPSAACWSASMCWLGPWGMSSILPQEVLRSLRPRARFASFVLPDGCVGRVSSVRDELHPLLYGWVRPHRVLPHTRLFWCRRGGGMSCHVIHPRRCLQTQYQQQQ